MPICPKGGGETCFPDLLYQEEFETGNLDSETPSDKWTKLEETSCIPWPHKTFGDLLSARPWAGKRKWED